MVRYPFTGSKGAGRGRPKVYAGKVNCDNIDKRHIKIFVEDDHAYYNSGIVYCMVLK